MNEIDWVVVRLVYDDGIEYTSAMHRWLAEVVVGMLAGGWQWTPGRIARRARIVTLP